MTGAQPPLAVADVLPLIEEVFGSAPADIQIVSGGEIARVFSFHVNDEAYVIRVNPQSIGVSFEKEAYIARHISSPAVPIPEIVALGTLDERWYAISRKAPGVRLNETPRAERDALIPRIMQTLDAIHGSVMPPTSGAGTFDGRGVGLFSGWRESLVAIREEQAEGSFFGRWHRLFTETFLERDVFDRVYDFAAQLLEHCPEERALVHGDFGFGNVLIHKGSVSAVLDWANAKYGDPLFDVAWMELWDVDGRYASRFERSYAENDLEKPNYWARIRCYQCWIALDAMRFYAKTAQEDGYRWIRGRALDLLAALQDQW